MLQHGLSMRAKGEVATHKQRLSSAREHEDEYLSTHKLAIQNRLSADEEKLQSALICVLTDIAFESFP